MKELSQEIQDRLYQELLPLSDQSDRLHSLRNELYRIGMETLGVDTPREVELWRTNYRGAKQEGETSTGSDTQRTSPEDPNTSRETPATMLPYEDYTIIRRLKPRKEGPDQDLDNTSTRTNADLKRKDDLDKLRSNWPRGRY